MPEKPNDHTAEGFVGSVFKYSISTFANIGIMALAIILTGFIPTGVYGQMSLFNDATNTIMTIAILGLDQALIRFYYHPPAGLTKNGLFRVCFYFASIVLLVGGAMCSTLLLYPVYKAMPFTMIGPVVLPLAFLNAFFFMVARYFNVLYRMEHNILVYTVQSILMQFFFKLFYVAGYYMDRQNPLPMMIGFSLAGLGGFALVFGFLRRSMLRPRKAEFTRSAYHTVLPYGLAIAPTAVFVTLNALIPKSYIGNSLGTDMLGVYSFIYTLSSAVTLVQGGFASFWGPYMFEHYKTEQKRIKRVHDYLNFAILAFFCMLVAFEDVAFFIFKQHAIGQPAFPAMMLGAVFTILCETTVYGNAIARRPIFDTLGIGLSFVTNIVFCLLLVPPLGLVGGAVAVALANFAMFLFRTLTAQNLYASIQTPLRTVVAVALAMLVAVAGTLLSANFVPKLLVCFAALGMYCVLYSPQLKRLVNLAFSILGMLFKRGKT